MSPLAKTRPIMLRVSSPKELLEQVRRLGHSPEDVFVKVEKEASFAFMASLPSSHLTLNKHPNWALVNEFRRLARISSIIPQNVATPIALFGGSDARISGYVAAFVDGKRLGNYSCSATEGKRVLLESINALLEIHGKRVAHGDITEDNILISSDGKVKFIDPFPRSTEAFNLDISYMRLIVRDFTEKFGISRIDYEALDNMVLQAHPQFALRP